MYCKQGIIGAQFSHTQRGHALCCASYVRHNKNPKDVWERALLDARQQLKDNKKITDCKPCYQSEQKQITSFRQIYNEQFKELNESSLPQHLDLDLSNLCNLKCVMCDPTRSSMWAKETGDYSKTNGVTSVSDHELQEICELSHDLKYLTLQGGEPSIIPQYETYFDYLKTNNLMKDITLNVVTNLTNLKQKFYSYLPYFKSVNISVSVDAFGTANDFIRFPSNFDKITENIKLLTRYDNMTVRVDTAIQILSMFNVEKLIAWLDDLEGYFESRKRYIGPYVQHVHTPEALCIMNAPRSLKDSFTKQIKGTRFAYLENTLDPKNEFDQNKTIHYIENICRRRKLNIDDYIPQFRSHYDIK